MKKRARSWLRGHKRRALYALVLWNACFTGAAYASISGTPLADVLCYIIDWLHGNLGSGLATLGVSAVAVGAIFGKVSWGLALTVVVGVGVMFGAADILVQAGAISGDVCL